MTPHNPGIDPITDTCQRYGDWRPTAYDPAGSFLPDRAAWCVMPTMRGRGCRHLDESNFAAAAERLKATDPNGNGYEVHRFRHWACGWFEVILVDPESPTADEAARIVADLDASPVLDEDDYNERRFEAACEWWSRMHLRDRIELCARYKVSIFAARHDYIPDNDRVIDYLESA